MSNEIGNEIEEFLNEAKKKEENIENKENLEKEAKEED